jgi:hypothetical protein
MNKIIIMKILALLAVLPLLVIASGCVQEPADACLKFCQGENHIEQCTGHWTATGSFPDCLCEWTCEATSTCQDYCQTQAHAQCVGSWNITGDYPNCVCGWDCQTEPEKVELTVKPGDKMCAFHSFDMQVGDHVTVYINGKEHLLNVTKISSGGLTTFVVDNFYTRMLTTLYQFDSLNGVGLYMKSVAYKKEGGSHVTILVGENRVNSPTDCYGAE